MIRPATSEDLRFLPGIERLAGERFREVGLREVADDVPFSVDELARYAAEGRCWVALDRSGQPVGYVLVDTVDGNAHIEQVSVVPDHQGAGVGRALIDRVRAWATERHMAAITLTTFTDVPWNAPLYRHLGFRDLTEREIGPELQAVRDLETAEGLDPATRICMRLELSG